MTTPYISNAPGLNQAYQSILAERERQKTQEGYTTDHDDQLDDGQLFQAATIYYFYGTETPVAFQRGPDGTPTIPLYWKLAPSMWKPRTRRENLIRAGALCLAEQERYQRVEIPCLHIETRLNQIVNTLASLI
jgi:hypothetical protein